MKNSEKIPYNSNDSFRKLQLAMPDASRVQLKSSLIQKAQEYTGSNSVNPDVLIKRVKKQNAIEARKHNIEEGRKFNMSGAQYERLQRKAMALLDNLATGYSMGDHKTLKINGKTFASADTTSQYSGKYRGSETYGSIVVDFTKADLERVEIIHGIITIRGENGRAKWLMEQGEKQYYEITWEKGYLIGTSHAKTKEEALALEKAKARAAKKFDDHDFLGIKDIKNAGACEAGIINFCRKHGLNPDYGYRLDYLKSLNGAGTSYFNRLSK